MENIPETYPDIMCSQKNDNMAFGAIIAIKAAGKTCGPKGEITIISLTLLISFESYDCGDLDLPLSVTFAWAHV